MIKVRIKKLPKAKTGYQLQGALVNDVPAMGGADYNAYIGKEKLRESKYITKVPRHLANLEAEGGETVYGDINGDGMPEHKIIKGPRHSAGGVPLSLPEDTFIFSDTRSMRVKDPTILAMFGKSPGKSYTPAELAKQYDIQKYRKILEDPDTDQIERKSAELMIKKYVIKLGCLALAQESMKGFPQGIPAVAKPCMEARGISEDQILPSKELSGLNDQLEKKMNSQQENSEQTMESENQQGSMEQAQEMNQGQPVAQGQQPPSQEEMMMYGGYRRRLRRGQQGMEQPSPEEMAMMQQQQQGQQPQGGGEDEMMQIMQEVQAALQRGAQPAEVVMSLLQNGIPPEAVVQIFTQLGASQEEAVGLIQQVMAQAQGGGQGQEQQMAAQQPQMSEEEMMQQQMMQQQAAPMAMYGMSMGGYDMPFYDIPQAEYGMAMGANSQNYQGRKGRVPSTGPMYNLAKAQKGIDTPPAPVVIDATNMTEAQLNNEIWTAKQKDPNAVIHVKRKDANGNVKTQLLKQSGFTLPSGSDIPATGLEGFPDTPNGRIAAAQYLLIKENLNDPKVREEIINNTKQVIENPEAWRGKNATSADPNAKWSVKYGTAPTDDEIINASLMLNKRNLMFEANEIDPQLFSDVGNKLDDAATVVSKGYINPKTQKPYTVAEAQAAIDKLNHDGYTNVAVMSEKLGVPLDPRGRDRVLQQSAMHAYALAHKKFKDGAYDSDPAAKYAMDGFLGNVGQVQSGANDETSMTGLYGPLGSKISPLDDKYDYSNNNWYQKKADGTLDRGKFTTYGDTTAGEKFMVGKRSQVFEDLPPDPNCQCEDQSKPNYSTYKDDKGNCTCTPPAEKKNCPCKKSDGTEINMTPNADGSCPPCTEDKQVPVPKPPAQWWLQDTIKTTGAFGDMMGLKKYMDWNPITEYGTPRPTFQDPAAELADNRAQALIQTQGMGQFAGAQQMSGRSAGIQGQAAKNAANILAKYNNANVNIANDFELKGVDIRNQETAQRAAMADKLYDSNTIANQQYDNAKLAMRNNVRNYYTDAITNRWKTDALNQMYPNYAVNPGNGGEMGFIPSEKNPTGQTTSSGMDYDQAIAWCRQNNPGAQDQSACMQRVMQASANRTGASSTASPGAINTMYGSQSKEYGGSIYDDGGFVHINSWLPFIL